MAAAGADVDGGDEKPSPALPPRKCRVRLCCGSVECCDCCVPRTPCQKECLKLVVVVSGFFSLVFFLFCYNLFFNLQGYQEMALQRQEGDPSRLVFLSFFAVVEAFWAMNPTYLHSQRLYYGPNFYASGQVVLGSWQDVHEALLTPQARTVRLGASPFIPSYLPQRDDTDDTTFLLALSQEEAGGNGDHGAFKKAIESVLFNHQTAARQGDTTSQRLIEEFAEEYVASASSDQEAFFNTPGEGWLKFNIRYMHYVLFGLDPYSGANVDLFTKAFYGSDGFAGPSHYLMPVGFFLNPGHQKALLEEVAAVYASSPAIKDFPEEDPRYNFLSRNELTSLLTSMMSIAALQGPSHLGRTAMGSRPFPDYDGASLPSPERLRELWDAMVLDDEEALELHLLECARLFQPVSASHRVATKPFSAVIGGFERDFPAGTKVLIPTLLQALDPELWGPTVLQFDPQRAGLTENSTSFNSLGNRHAGRICPGKSVSLTMLIEVLQIVGAARRAANVV